MLLTLMLALCVASRPPAQTTQTQQTMGVQRPPRDVTADKKGTGVIRGRITNTEGRALRRVQLRLNGESIPEGRTASTNGLGQYEIRELPAGRFMLFASRAGYLGMAYGQARSGEPGRPIELADGQTIEKLDLVLPHTALISGRVLDEAGEPLAGATVMPMQMRFFNGKRRMLPFRTAVTDDTGQFRLSGLDPGEYYIQASSRETWEGDPPERQMLGFLPTFFPSAPNVGEAQRVRARAGQEAVGSDIGLIPGKVARVSGTVVSAQGQPLAGENINLGIEIRGESFQSFFGGQGTKVNPDGTFQFRNVAPGEYHLNVRTSAVADRPFEAANVTVSTVNGDVENLSIVTAPAGTVAGTVVLESDKLPVPLTRLFVRNLPVDRDSAINIGSAPDNGRVRDDGTFELKAVVGSNRLTVGGLPEGWAIRRIDQGGKDYTTTPFDTFGQTLDGFTIVLTNRFPVVSGVLRDDKGNPAAGGTAILFPEEASLWAEDLRTVRTARPDQSGVFGIRAIRPGDYLAIAVPTVQNNQWNDPEYLESLRSNATRISLKEGDSPRLELVVRAPEVR